MADAEFTIWQGTLLPIISATLYGAKGSLLDLTGQPLFFRLLKSGVLVFEAPAEVNDPDPKKGKIRYRWQLGDTDRTGMFDAQWRVGLGSNSMLLPLTRYNRVRINPNVNGGGGGGGGNPALPLISPTLITVSAIAELRGVAPGGVALSFMQSGQTVAHVRASGRNYWLDTTTGSPDDDSNIITAADGRQWIGE